MVQVFLPTMSNVEQIKQQVEMEINQKSVQQLMALMIPKCFDRCVKQINSSTSYSEESCLQYCGKKYQASMNVVMLSLFTRLKEEQGL